MNDGKLGAGERVRQTRVNGNFPAWSRGDCARAPRQTSGKTPNVVGEIGHCKWDLAQIVERHRGVERSDYPAVVFRDDSIGARLTCPALFIVDTTVSRIIGIGLPLSSPQSVPGFSQACESIFHRRIGSGSPIERKNLGVAFAETPGDFRFHQLGTEIEGMGAVVLYAQFGEQCHCVLRDAMDLRLKT